MKNKFTINSLAYHVILISFLGLAACSTKNDDGSKESGAPTTTEVPAVLEKLGSPDQRQEAAKKAQEYIRSMDEIMQMKALTASDCLRIGIFSSQLNRFAIQLKQENSKNATKNIKSMNEGLAEVGATTVDRISGFTSCLGTTYMEGWRLDLLLRQQTLVAVVDLATSEDLYLADSAANYNLEIELRRILLSNNSQLSGLLSYEGGWDEFKQKPSDDFWKRRYNEKKSEYFFELGNFVANKEFVLDSIKMQKKLDATAAAKLSQILSNLNALKSVATENDDEEIAIQKNKLKSLDQSVRDLLERVQK